MFEPRVALASLSGEADAEWATASAEWAGAAVLGGVCLDEESRAAASAMVEDRDRSEFLPEDPFAFIDHELAALADVDIRPGINVRATTPEPIAEAAAIAADHDALLELNAHCRQAELREVGCGETLLRDVARLREYVAAASDAGAAVCVKVRAEVNGVDLVAVAESIEAAGGAAIHVDAMDSESVIRELADATDLFVIANNGVRDEESVREYLDYGADAVSVGRPSDDPAVLGRVLEAVQRWETEQSPPEVEP